LPQSRGLIKCLLIVIGANQAQLLIKLCIVVALAADDPENYFCYVPVHYCFIFGID
jgi:hypothetical protein